MRDKRFINLLLSLALRSLDRDYGLGFFCSIEKAESPCRTLVTLVDRNGQNTMGEARKESLQSIILYITLFYMSHAVFS